MCHFKEPTSLNGTTDIIAISSVEQIPTLETIQAIPRGRILKLVFEKAVQSQRESVGQKLKNEFSGFQIGIHTIEPEIKLIKKGLYTGQ